MQQTFELAVLLPPAAFVLSVSAIIAWLATRSLILAVAVAVIKTCTYLIYYGLMFDGTYTFIDDWSYLERGASLVDADVHWLNLVENLELLFAVGQGDHFLYYLYNATAIRWFGEGYYAPVALNIGATAFIAWWGMILARRERLCSPELAGAFFCFLILHPDLLAWSTVMNGKDVLVLLLHIALLSAVASCYRGKLLTAGLIASGATAILFFLRFYVPFMFALAFALVATLNASGWRRARLLAVAGLLLGGVLIQMGDIGLDYVIQRLSEDLVNPAFGLVRLLLTPIPFHTDDNYAFLDLPATLHWILLPFAGLGFWQIWRLRTPFARFFAAYVIVFAALYSIYGELKGPRHRVQLDFALAICQFVGICYAAGLGRARGRLKACPAPDAPSTAVLR